LGTAPTERSSGPIKGIGPQDDNTEREGTGKSACATQK
jgi:hypothetical protein